MATLRATQSTSQTTAVNQPALTLRQRRFIGKFLTHLALMLGIVLIFIPLF